MHVPVFYVCPVRRDANYHRTQKRRKAVEFGKVGDSPVYARPPLAPGCRMPRSAVGRVRPASPPSPRRRAGSPPRDRLQHSRSSRLVIGSNVHNITDNVHNITDNGITSQITGCCITHYTKLLTLLCHT